MLFVWYADFGGLALVGNLLDGWFWINIVNMLPNLIIFSMYTVHCTAFMYHCRLQKQWHTFRCTHTIQQRQNLPTFCLSRVYSGLVILKFDFRALKNSPQFWILLCCTKVKILNKFGIYRRRPKDFPFVFCQLFRWKTESILFCLLSFFWSEMG